VLVGVNVRLPFWCSQPKIPNTQYDGTFAKAILLELDTQFTDQEDSCEAMHEQKEQNLVVLHLV
jgi:hypothetical protein